MLVFPRRVEHAFDVGGSTLASHRRDVKVKVGRANST
jgi:hypothetical protein